MIDGCQPTLGPCPPFISSFGDVGRKIVAEFYDEEDDVDEKLNKPRGGC